MPKLQSERTINGFKFELVDNRYECRGATFYDEEHDQIPEPNLQTAAYKLQALLLSEGVDSNIEFGEKGWIEIYIED